eukprot:CCRYP_000849-RA/>CCRYP_000849-RA protein AED:0.64 eAED:0.25 QI:0/0/0/0.5/1/1/2/0/599
MTIGYASGCFLLGVSLLLFHSSVDQHLRWIGGPNLSHLGLWLFLHSKQIQARWFHTMQHLGSFILRDVPALVSELFAPDSLANLQHDLDTILNSGISSSQSTLSAPNNVHRLDHPPPLSTAHDIPWIKHHLSTTRPASRPIRLRLLHYIGCLLPFGSLLLPVASSRPTFVLHRLSSYPHLPSALVHDSAQILWAPIGWRTRRHFIRITQKHETVLAKLINSSQLGLSASEPLSLSFPERPPHFVDSFNPALAGINLLLTERFNRILTLSPPLQQSVSIDIIEASPNLQSFPVLLESAYTSSPTLTTPPLIVDTDDFVSYAPSAAKIRDLSGINTVAGKGLLCWRVLDHQGREHAIELKGYHIPNASVRLLSPQAMFQSLGGHGEQDISKYSINLPGGPILHAPYGNGNLPILPLCPPDRAPHCFWTRCFSFHASDRDIWARSILAASNQNLSLAQKELLLWHHRLSHAGLSTIQNISRQRRTLTPSSTDELVRLAMDLFSRVLTTSPAPCDHLLCAACEISKATRRAPTIRSSRNHAPRQMVLKEDHVKPGDCVSCDHFISPVPGRITFPSGHSSSRNGFTCGTISSTTVARSSTFTTS